MTLKLIRKFHASKQAIALNLVNTNQTLISDKFEHSDKGFKCFIGYIDNNIIRPLRTALPKISVYIQYFDSGGIKICLSWLKMIAHWLNIMKFKTKLKKNIEHKISQHACLW